jgi:adenylylsulfate kinase
MRDNYAADFTIWVDTITEGRYEDTNLVFEPPNNYDIRVTEQDATKWSKIILEKINERKI